MGDKIIIVLGNRRYEMGMLDDFGEACRKRDFIDFINTIMPDAEIEESSI